MVPRLIPKQSQIGANIHCKIDAKLAIQNSSKNRASERQMVAKVTSSIRKREVSGLEGSPGRVENRTLWPLDHPQVIPTNIYIYICIYVCIYGSI